MNIVLHLNHAPEPAALDIADKAGWSLQTVNTPLDVQHLEALIEFWHPVGIIVNADNETKPTPLGALGGIPIVYCTWNAKVLPPKAYAIVFDSCETGRIAAREQLLLGGVHFAYVHPQDVPGWSVEREDGYRKALAVNGFTPAVFRTKRRGLDYQKDLHGFLAALPRPCAVFAANDEVGAEVLAATQKLGIAVPDEMSVLGVDNRTEICEHTHPPLSSIRPNFARSDELAALLLLTLLQNGKRDQGPRRQAYGPAGVTHRASTRLLRRPDSTVSAALDRIAAGACTGLRARDVVALFPCARPIAEARFRAATGHSILEEIHLARLSRAKELLERPGIQLKAIASFCGFANPASMGKFFRLKTGLTMSAWRTAHARDAVKPPR